MNEWDKDRFERKLQEKVDIWRRETAAGHIIRENARHQREAETSHQASAEGSKEPMP